MKQRVNHKIYLLIGGSVELCSAKDLIKAWDALSIAPISQGKWLVKNAAFTPKRNATLSLHYSLHHSLLSMIPR